MLCNADGVEGVVTFYGKKRYECVRFNVISVTRGWVGVQFQEEKKRHVGLGPTLEWLPIGNLADRIITQLCHGNINIILNS